jgi:hypothetical protein
MVRRSPDWTFLTTREQYLAQAASLHRAGHLVRQMGISIQAAQAMRRKPPEAPEEIRIEIHLVGVPSGPPVSVLD